MATRLTKLRLREVSLVDFPANDAARVLLAKRDGAAPADGEVEVSKAFQFGKAGDFDDAAEYEDEDDLDDEGDEDDDDLNGDAFDEDEDELDDEDDDDSDDEGGASDDADSDNPDHQEDAMKLDEKVLKGLTPEAAEVLKAAAAKAEAAEAAIAKAQEEVAKLREEREVAKFTDIAKAMLGDVQVVKAEELAPLLRKASEAEQALLTKLCGAAVEARKSARLFEELGVETEDGPQDVSKAEGLIDARAKEIMKSSNGKVGYAEAYVAALAEMPDAYELTVNS